MFKYSLPTFKRLAFISISFVFLSNSLNAQSKLAEPPSVSKSDILARAFIIDESRLLIAGDVIRFQVFEDEEQPILIKVNELGFADFPYLGRRKLQGLNCKQISENISKELEETFYYKATVFIAVEQENPVRGKIYVIGEVGSQGVQNIPANMEFTVSKAILAAGGFGRYAKKDSVKLIRKKADGTEETTEIDVEDIFKNGVQKNDLPLQPNDFVIVPKRAINFN